MLAVRDINMELICFAHKDAQFGADTSQRYFVPTGYVQMNVSRKRHDLRPTGAASRAH